MSESTRSRALAQAEVIRRCIDLLNELDTIEARRDVARWLATAYEIKTAKLKED